MLTTEEVAVKNPYVARRIAVQPNGCWSWTAFLDGCGYAAYRGKGHRTSTVHRVIYEQFIGPVPAGLELDHLCHDPEVCRLGNECPHRRCVNPAHLGLATHAENSLRSASPAALNAHKTKCNSGHPFTPENTYRHKSNRVCRACNRAAVARYKARRRARFASLAETTTTTEEA